MVRLPACTRDHAHSRERGRVCGAASVGSLPRASDEFVARQLRPFQNAKVGGTPFLSPLGGAQNSVHRRSDPRHVGAPGLPEPRPRVPRPRSLLCASHTITRVQNTLDTHAARVCGAPPPHMLTHGNTRLHVKMLLRCSCHWPLADHQSARHLHPPARTRYTITRQLRCSRGACVTPTRCTCHSPPTACCTASAQNK